MKQPLHLQAQTARAAVAMEACMTDNKQQHTSVQHHNNTNNKKQHKQHNGKKKKALHQPFRSDAATESGRLVLRCTSGEPSPTVTEVLWFGEKTAGKGL